MHTPETAQSAHTIAQALDLTARTVRARARSQDERWRHWHIRPRRDDETQHHRNTVELIWIDGPDDLLREPPATDAERAMLQELYNASLRAKEPSKEARVIAWLEARLSQQSQLIELQRQRIARLERVHIRPSHLASRCY